MPETHESVKKLKLLKAIPLPFDCEKGFCDFSDNTLAQKAPDSQSSDKCFTEYSKITDERMQLRHKYIKSNESTASNINTSFNTSQSSPSAIASNDNTFSKASIAESG